MIPRRLRSCRAHPFYVVECAEVPTVEMAAYLRRAVQLAITMRVPPALVLGPGCTVKEFRR